VPRRGLPARAGGLNLLPEGSVDKFRDAAARSAAFVVARVWGGLLGHEGVHCLGEAQHGSGEEQTQELQDLHPPGKKEAAPPWGESKESECCRPRHCSYGEAGKGWGTPPPLALDLCVPSHPTSTDAAPWEWAREAITLWCLIHSNPLLLVSRS